MNHILGHSSNLHLQSAILKHGLCMFAFVILDYCNLSDHFVLDNYRGQKAQTRGQEQHYLDILFSLADNLRYNFARFAEASFRGLTHTVESRAKISKANKGLNSGANNPLYGKVPASAFQSGHVPANAMTINVYAIDNVLVQTFSSQVVAAKWAGVSRVTVQNYIKSGKVFKNQYRFKKSGSI